MSDRSSILQNLIFFGLALLCGIIIIHSVEEQITLTTNDVSSAKKGSFHTVGSHITQNGRTPSGPAPVIPDIEIAHDEPLQGDLGHPQIFDFKGYQIRELASFYAHAVLLSKHEYNSNAEGHRSALSPCDFSIGWGPMSNPSILRHFTYFQNNRFFYYASMMSFAEESTKLHVDWHVANVHLIPANDNIAEAIKKIHPRDIVTLEGMLIEVGYKNQVLWKSSLSRTDTGDGACELLFLTHLSWTSQPPETASIPLPQAPNN